MKADLEKEQAVFSLSLAGKKLSLEVSQNQKNQSVLQQRGTLEKEQKNDKKWDRKFLIQKTAEFLRREIEK
ncbi:MAG: hypothetical protein K9M51_03440 [Candidatus Gracilibacteria bacterium]|nr:hypothetical protein [Candidatus Gracilibacteria bacterium]